MMGTLIRGTYAIRIAEMWSVETAYSNITKTVMTTIHWTVIVVLLTACLCVAMAMSKEQSNARMEMPMTMIIARISADGRSAEMALSGTRKEEIRLATTKMWMAQMIAPMSANMLNAEMALFINFTKNAMMGIITVLLGLACESV